MGRAAIPQATERQSFGRWQTWQRLAMGLKRWATGTLYPWEDATGNENCARENRRWGQGAPENHSAVRTSRTWLPTPIQQFQHPNLAPTRVLAKHQTEEPV